MRLKPPAAIMLELPTSEARRKARGSWREGYCTRARSQLAHTEYQSMGRQINSLRFRAPKLPRRIPIRRARLPLHDGLPVCACLRWGAGEFPLILGHAPARNSIRLSDWSQLTSREPLMVSFSYGADIDGCLG